MLSLKVLFFHATCMASMCNTCKDGLIAANAEAIAMYIQSLLAFAAQTRSTVKAMFPDFSRHTAFRSFECVCATVG